MDESTMSDGGSTPVTPPEDWLVLMEGCGDRFWGTGEPFGDTSSADPFSERELETTIGGGWW